MSVPPSAIRKQTISAAQFKRQLASLKARKMIGTDNVWEARIDYHYRITFQFEGDATICRVVGTHGIYRKAQKLWANSFLQIIGCNPISH